MKDSQDWLDRTLVEFLEPDKASFLRADEIMRIRPELKGLSKFIKAYALKEALELIDAPELSKVVNAKINELETITYHKHHYVRKTGLKRVIKDTTRQELRNKFNDKYKED